MNDQEEYTCAVCDAPYGRLWGGEWWCSQCIMVELLREVLHELRSGVKVIG